MTEIDPSWGNASNPYRNDKDAEIAYLKSCIQDLEDEVERLKPKPIPLPYDSIVKRNIIIAFICAGVLAAGFIAYGFLVPSPNVKTGSAEAIRYQLWAKTCTDVCKKEKKLFPHSDDSCYSCPPDPDPERLVGAAGRLFPNSMGKFMQCTCMGHRGNTKKLVTLIPQSKNSK